MSRLLTVAIVLLVMSGAARADRWPLHPGCTWTYLSDYDGQTQFVEVLPQTRVVRGVECIVLLKELNQIGGLQRVHYFLTKNAEGDVWMHGFEDLDDGRQISLDPPVQVLDQPMVMGNRWSTRSTSYMGLDPGGEPRLRFVETYEVAEDKIFDFVFGTHQAYGLIKTMWISPDFPAEADAEPWPALFPDTTKSFASIFFSEGYGITLEYTMWLTGSSRPLPAEQTTWSDFKRLYR